MLPSSCTKDSIFYTFKNSTYRNTLLAMSTLDRSMMAGVKLC